MMQNKQVKAGVNAACAAPGALLSITTDLGSYQHKPRTSRTGGGARFRAS